MPKVTLTNAELKRLIDDYDNRSGFDSAYAAISVIPEDIRRYRKACKINQSRAAQLRRYLPKKR